MLTTTANRDTRLSFWLRVREFAVPPSMIEAATARRSAGDWAAACAAAGIDVDLDLRRLARTHGRELAARIRTDLRHLAPDLLRWHMPRIAPDGLLRPGLTVSLARYDQAADRDSRHPVHLVVRTAPAWADAGQRISLALWHGPRSAADSSRHPNLHPHPHPRPDRRFRLDLHRHLWDARRAPELRTRSGADRPPAGGHPQTDGTVPSGIGCNVDRWADEARILLHDEGRSGGAVTVRLGARHRLVLDLSDPDPHPELSGPPVLRIAGAPGDGGASALPVLPEAATWVPPDLELLRAGAIGPGRLHPLVAAALVPDRPPPDAPADRSATRSGARSGHREGPGAPHLVDCRGARHRIGLVDGVLAPMDHHPDEVRREELLAALTGTPLPCLQAIDEAHRRPECLAGVRERLDHGDIAGALAVVEGLLGPAALLRSGELRDELEAAAQQRITHGLFRAGLAGPSADRPRPDRTDPARPRPHVHRAHPRHASGR
ncbi:hypothetical protein [Kitasatospora sp. MBT63]|uniref:hypothetical protein n=1 Tax=Kitasatospora sp. MBT63 TaxID=1444768 RepID=UPI00053A9861|nr:hypothetical protein [Kitasatospora sp. MBT63]